MIVGGLIEDFVTGLRMNPLSDVVGHCSRVLFCLGDSVSVNDPSRDVETIRNVKKRNITEKKQNRKETNK